MTKKELEDLKALMEPDYEDEDEAQIDFMKYVRILWSKRRYFYISIPVTFVVALILSLGRPKYYVVNEKLAPELSSMTSSSGGLNSILRNFGLRGMSSSSADGDAILPNLYPDLMNSQAFRVSLFDVPVESRDHKIQTTYFDYLENHQKRSWFSSIVGGVFRAIGSLASGRDKAEDTLSLQQPLNPLALNLRQTKIAKAIAQNVVCDVDERTYVISISVKAQDPVICATVADSASRRLQEFITDYRMKKAKVEYDHVQEQYDLAEREYNEAKDRFAAYSNGNWDIASESATVEKQALQNQMQLKFQAYSTMAQQLLAARVKLDEARPVFTVLDGANVPLSPAGPRRLGFVLGWILLVCFIQTGYLLRKEFSYKDKAQEI